MLAIKRPDTSAIGRIELGIAPFFLSGVVYGSLLNHEAVIVRLGAAMHEAPYKAPPQAPVLYIKPRNTIISHGESVTIPADAPELEIGASLGIVIGRTACRVDEEHALDYVAGYTIVNDICVPHDVFYRPSVRFRARDGFCPVGPGFVPRSDIARPDALGVRVHVDGKLVQSTTTGERRRGVARLLADVSEFMTLSPGDVLTLGVSDGAPRVRAGQSAGIEIDGLGRLENPFTHAGAAA